MTLNRTQFALAALLVACACEARSLAGFVAEVTTPSSSAARVASAARVPLPTAIERPGMSEPTAAVDPVTPADALVRLPAPPGSLELSLSVLATLGACHLGRSARRINLGTLPEWYHEQSPRQIGYATALDLEHFEWAAACFWEAPTADPLPLAEDADLAPPPLTGRTLPSLGGRDPPLAA